MQETEEENDTNFSLGVNLEKLYGETRKGKHKDFHNAKTQLLRKKTNKSEPTSMSL